MLLWQAPELAGPASAGQHSMRGIAVEAAKSAASAGDPYAHAVPAEALPLMKSKAGRVRPLFVCLMGGSCCGKSTRAVALSRRLGETLIMVEDYYCEPPCMPG